MPKTPKAIIKEWLDAFVPNRAVHNESNAYDLVAAIEMAGFAIVSREPTPEMILEGDRKFNGERGEGSTPLNRIAPIYRAMITAASTPTGEK